MVKFALDLSEGLTQSDLGHGPSRSQVLILFMVVIFVLVHCWFLYVLNLCVGLAQSGPIPGAGFGVDIDDGVGVSLGLNPGPGPGLCFGFGLCWGLIFGLLPVLGLVLVLDLVLVSIVM